MLTKSVIKVALAAWILASAAGCDDERVVTEEKDSQAEHFSPPSPLSKVTILEDQARQQVLEMNLLLFNVQAYFDTLEQQGYVYREDASLAMINEHYEWYYIYESEVPGEDLSKNTPGAGWVQRVEFSDTLVFQSFENALLDSSLNSCITTFYRNGDCSTIFQELDITEPIPEFVRFGSIVDGSLLPEDMSERTDYWAEAVACCGACAFGCALTGPGWALCFSICCSSCLVGVMIHIILDAI